MLAPVPEYLRQPPAWFYSRILVGAGRVLTPSFASHYGITHVINCAFDECSPIWFRSRHPARYREIQAVDSETVNILDWYPRFESALRYFLQESTGVVYVHCQAGMNRSGFLTLAYVVKNFGLDMDAVIRAAKQQRPCVLSNPVFMNQVKEFINHGRLSSSQNTGIELSVLCRDSGLPASGDCTEPSGDQDQAGESHVGENKSEAGDLGPVFSE